jgi:S1-C subfamily serine protease
MKALIRTSFIPAVLGGAVVAAAFLLLGVTGHRTTQTIVEEAPVAGHPASNTTSTLTPHDIYVRDAPGVVFVRAEVIEQVQDPFNLFPQQESSTSTGSGFLIDRGGHIITNYHVIQGANRQSGVTVQFEDNVTRRALVVGQDPGNDLALLKVDLSGVPTVQPLALGDSTTVRVGDPTLAIGNPFGLDRTLTSGIVSALQRQIQAPNGFSIDNVIQTDAPINPGNSGGPLLDATGRVIGINSQIATANGGSGGSVGIAFAVPINTAKDILGGLENGGPVRVAYLGVRCAPAPGAVGGVVVKNVQPGGPAANAGLRRGDHIQTIDGHSVDSMDDVQALVQARPPGQAILLRTIRRGHARMVRALLGSRPASAPAP